MQILAYAGLSQSHNVIAALVYPCSFERWTSLSKRGKLFHRAHLTSGSRLLTLLLTAVPMNGALDLAAKRITEEVQAMLGNHAAKKDSPYEATAVN